MAEQALTASVNQQGMQEVQHETQKTAQELMNMRAAFLFTSFAMMAMAQIIDQITSKFDDMRQAMVDAWGDIEYQAVVVSTILKGTGEVADEVSERMLELGRQTEWTAEEAGEAMEYLARAGLRMEETMGAVEPVMNMATASSMELQEAARFAAGAYRGWNLEAEKASHVQQNVAMVSSEVAHAARRSRQEVDEMAQAFKFATAAATTVGWSLEEVTAGLMIMADNMIDAGMAGRSFRRVMTRVGQVAGDVGVGIQQVRDLVDEYGISLTNREGEMVSFIGFIEELEEAVEDLNSTERIQLYQALAGQRAMSGLAAVVDEGSDTLREYRTELELSGAAEAIFIEHGYDARDMFGEWYEQYEKAREAGHEHVDILETLQEDWGMSTEVAYRLQSAFDEVYESGTDMSDVLGEITLVSEQAQARLETLKGTQILLKSSTEALWASLAKGEFARIITMWNRAIRRFADLVSALPSPLRAFLGIFILIGSTINRVVPQLFMMVAMLTIQRAAIASLRLEMFQQQKAQIMNIQLNAKQIETVMGVIQSKHLKGQVTKMDIKLQLLQGKTLNDLIGTKIRENVTEIENVKTKLTLIQMRNADTQAQMKQLFMGGQNNMMLEMQKVAVLGAAKAYGMLFVKSMLVMGGISLLIYGFTFQNKLMKRVAVVLISVAASMSVLRLAQDQLNLSTKALTISLIGAGVAAFGFISLGIRLEGVAKAVAGAFFIATGATLALAMAFTALNVSTAGIVYAIVALITGVVLLLDYFLDFTDSIYGVDQAMVGNTLFDSFMMIANVIGYVADAVKFIIGLFRELWVMIRNLSESFIGLGDLANTLMGNSIIPESFERGASRIRSVMEGLRQEIGFDVPRGFAKNDNVMITEKPYFTLDMSNFTSKREMEPEELQELVERGIENALKEYDRQLARG